MSRFARCARVLVPALCLTVLSALPQLAAPAFAQSQEPTAAHLAAARSVVVASGLERSFDAVVPSLFEQVKQVLVTRPELTQDLNEVVEKITPEFESKKSEMIAAAARVFASQLSEEDLTAIATFFESPVGKRYVTTQPEVLNQLYTEMQNWSQSMSSLVVERLRAEMRARGKEF
jgi:hypothetical protein